MAAKKNDELWRINYQDNEFTLHGSDLTVGVFRQMGQWYGPAYAKYSTFIGLLMEGDANAWACAIWIVHRAAGVKCRRPQELDFAVSDVMRGPDSEEDDEDDFADAEDEEPAIPPDPTSPVA